MIKVDLKEEKKEVEIEGKTIEIYKELIVLIAYLKGNMVHCDIEPEIADEELRRVIECGLKNYEPALEDYENVEIVTKN